MSDRRPPVDPSLPLDRPRAPDVWGVYEAATGSVQYVVACPRTRRAIVDTVLDFDPKRRDGRGGVERMLGLLEARRA